MDKGPIGSDINLRIQNNIQPRMDKSKKFMTMTLISLDQGDTQRIGSVYSARFQRFQSVYLPVLNHIKVIGVAMLQYGESVIIIKVPSIFTVVFLT